MPGTRRPRWLSLSSLCRGVQSLLARACLLFQVKNTLSVLGTEFREQQEEREWDLSVCQKDETTGLKQEIGCFIEYMNGSKGWDLFTCERR